MIQSRRNRIYTIDAKLYLLDEYASRLNELESILDEEAADYEAMPEGSRQSDRGEESRQAQAYLQKVVKALGKVVDGKRKQELMDIVHENLRFL